MMNLFDVTMESARRLTRIFPGDEKGGGPPTAVPKNSRPIRIGGTMSSSMSISTATMVRGLVPATRPAGPGLVAKLIQLLNVLDPEKVLKGSTRPVMTAR
jgi:hypothetical protein